MFIWKGVKNDAKHSFSLLFFLASVISAVNTASLGLRSFRFLMEIQKYSSYNAFPNVPSYL